MNEEKARLLYASMLQMMNNLQTLKPNDRSDMDRAFAIAIQDFQKLLAYISFWIVGPYTNTGEEPKIATPTAAEKRALSK